MVKEIPPPRTALKHGFPLPFPFNAFLTQDEIWNLGTLPTTHVLWLLCRLWRLSQGLVVLTLVWRNFPEPVSKHSTWLRRTAPAPMPGQARREEAEPGGIESSSTNLPVFFSEPEEGEREPRGSLACRQPPTPHQPALT